MIYPDVSLEEWLQRYPNLKVHSQECPECKKIISTDRPFRSKHYIGLEGLHCKECGYRIGSAVLRPISKKKIEEWKSFFS